MVTGNSDSETADHWQRVYREKREDEVSWFEAHPVTSLELIANTTAPKNAHIVDVGAGSSRLVDHLLDAGYSNLVVLELAETALDKARARLGARAAMVQWVASDVTKWEPSMRFDVWHDRAAFHFMVDPQARAAYLAVLRHALAVGGHAIIATFATDGPERCSGLPVVRYSSDELMAVFGPDFRRIETVPQSHTTPGGKVQSFQYTLFRRIS